MPQMRDSEFPKLQLMSLRINYTLQVLDAVRNKWKQNIISLPEEPRVESYI